MKIALIAVVAIVGIFGIIYVMGDDDESTKYYNEFTEEDVRNFELELFEITNQKRIENGVQPLVWDDRLHSIAKNHSQDMAEKNYFNHNNLDGMSAFDRGNNAYYECEKERESIMYEGISENISQMGLERKNYESIDEETIVDGLMNSSEHRENMLDNAYIKIGIGIAINENHLYTTQNFC